MGVESSYVFFPVSIEKIIWFLSFISLMWCITLVDLWILKCLKGYWSVLKAILMKSCNFLVLYITLLKVLCTFAVFVSGRRAPFNIACNAGLVVMNSLSFCLGKPLFLLHIWRITFLDGVFLADSFINFSILRVPFHSVLSCGVSAEKSADSLMGVPL